MSYPEPIENLEKTVSKMREVQKDFYVIKEDHNLSFDGAIYVYEALKECLREYTKRTGKDLPHIKSYLDWATDILLSTRYVKAGDIIEPSDHNNIVNVLKVLATALTQFEKELGIT